MSKVIAGLAGALSVGLLSVGVTGAAHASIAPATAPAWHSLMPKGFASGDTTAVTSVRYSGGKTAEFMFTTTAALSKTGGLAMFSRSGTETWGRVDIPIGKAGETPVAATATGPNQVFVFTKLPNGTSRVLKGNGHSVAFGAGTEYYYTWSVLTTFDATIGSATVLSPTDIWVFGSAAVVEGLGTWHFNGTKWTQVSKIMLQGSAASSHSAWAVAGPTEAHWDGTEWDAKNFGGALPRDEYFVSVYATGNGVYLIASDLLADAPNTITILQYNGHTWKKVATAGTGYAVPGAISGDGHGGIWFTTYAVHGVKSRVLHYANGAASVTASTLPGVGSAANQEVAIAQIPDTTQELTGGSIASGRADPATYATLYQYS